MKTCSGCGEGLPDSAFPSRLGMITARCRECVRARQRRWDNNNRERLNAARRNRRRLENASFAKAHRDQQKRKYWENPERKRRYVHDRYIKDPSRFKARARAKWALDNGEIVAASACERCGIEARLELHHPNYLLPLLVEQLCKLCHGKIRRTDLA